jgi:CDP-diglyceride synthetase
MKIHINPYYNIGKLQRWLEFELAGPVLLYLTYLGVPIFLTLLAALLVMPLLLKVLIVERKYGWLGTLILFVFGSFWTAYLFLDPADWMGNSSKLTIALMVSLGFFYFYCAILRVAIGGWTKDELEYELHT